MAPGGNAIDIPDVSTSLSLSDSSCSCVGSTLNVASRKLRSSFNLAIVAAADVIVAQALLWPGPDRGQASSSGALQAYQYQQHG
jgi:hypothetical protein